MITKIVLPRLTDTMEEGTIANWLKNIGDEVEFGEPIAEVETEKSTIEVESFGSGVLRKILAPKGETVPVGAEIAIIADPLDDISNL